MKIINQYPFHPYYSSINDRLAMDNVNYAIQKPVCRFFDPADGTDNVLWFEDSRSIRQNKPSNVWHKRNFDLPGNIPDYEQSAVYLDVWQIIINNFDS